METLIRKLESFGSLTDDDKLAIRSIEAQERIVVARKDIIVEGDDPSYVHLITSGLACRYKLIEDAKRQIVAYLLPGDFCDLHVFILNAMDHSIGAISGCTVVDIPRSSILDLLEQPRLSRALLMATLVDEATLREWITNIGQRRADERIAHLYCELYARMKAVGLANGGSFELPITQTELGDTVGLSTVHVNRSLQSLREQGLIELHRGSLQIPDIIRLKTMSGFKSNYLHLADN